MALMKCAGKGIIYRKIAAINTRKQKDTGKPIDAFNESVLFKKCVLKIIIDKNAIMQYAHVCTLPKAKGEKNNKMINKRSGILELLIRGIFIK